jgi:primosomal protein N' (replication factor Y)
MSTLFVEVAVLLPVIGTYYYQVPSHLRQKVAVGRQVLVPFGRRNLTGYVLSLDTTLSAEVQATVRDVLQVSSEVSYFSKADLTFYRWLSNYYLGPLGEVVQSVLPGGTSSRTRRVACATEAGVRSLFESRLSVEDTAVLSVLIEHP